MKSLVLISAFTGWMSLLSCICFLILNNVQSSWSLFESACLSLISGRNLIAEHGFFLLFWNKLLTKYLQLYVNLHQCLQSSWPLHVECRLGKCLIILSCSFSITQEVATEKNGFSSISRYFRFCIKNYLFLFLYSVHHSCKLSDIKHFPGCSWSRFIYWMQSATEVVQ